MKERIQEFILNESYNPKTAAELAEILGVPEAERPQFLGLLTEMEAQGLIVRTRTQRYGAPERMNLVVGRLQGHPKGFGFLIPDAEGQDDLFIGKENLGGAWNGDRIVARLVPVSTGNRPEGEVIRVLERGNLRIVGTFEAAKKAGYVRPDDRRLPDDISVPSGQTHGARSGEVVVVEVTRWPEPRRSAEGKVVERLGAKGSAGVNILAIIRKFGLPEQFGKKALAEAEAIPETVAPEEIARRRDLRHWQIITVDGADAKDLDDAISVEKLPEGGWRLGVHIADVSHYVREGGSLEREAFERATSVYLADRVVPMLPQRLSNGICSLNPQVDRLTLTCLMDIDAEGKVGRHELFASAIKTAARMTYAEVAGILRGDGDQRQRHAALVPMITEMAALKDKLRVRRQERGSLDFDLPEPKLVLDAQGLTIDVRRADRTHADQIVEEFMLAANETVARHFARAKVPFCFRVHEEPAADRVQGLSEFLLLFGYNLRPGKKMTPKALQQVTEWARGRQEEGLVNTVLLRSLRQARYSAENLGHFGLAAPFYCHFTSPIRRFPDLIVHRVVRALVVEGGFKAKRKARWQKEMPGWAEHCSVRERVAQEAERETVDLKKAEYMKDKVGEVYKGIISSVTSFGFFVQLENTVEGLVHVSTLTDDYYHFQEKQYALLGERTRKHFRLGDPVTVRVVRVNVEERNVDFMLEKMDAERGRPGPAAAPALEPARAAGPGPGRQAARVRPEPQPRPAARGKEKDLAKAPAKAPAKAHPEKVARVVVRDMWGVPIPVREDRPRRSGDEDQSISRSMLRSIQMVERRNRRRTGGAAPAAQPEAPPATRAETAATAPPETAAPKRRARRRGSRRRTKAEEPPKA